MPKPVNQLSTYGMVNITYPVGHAASAQLNFPRHGIKWLALSVAKLKPVP